MELTVIVGIGMRMETKISTKLIKQENCPKNQIGETKLLYITATIDIYHSIKVGIGVWKMSIGSLTVIEELFRSGGRFTPLRLSCCCEEGK